MLLPDDGGLVARDPALDALATVLDPEKFGAAIRAAAPEVALDRVEPWYLRYKPGTSCLAAYRLMIGGRNVIAHALTAVDPTKLRFRSGDEAPGGSFGTLGVHLRRGTILLRVFPNDPGLSRLRRLLDPTTRDRLLSGPLGGGSLELIGYKPDRRYVGRLTAPDGTFAVKLHAKNRFDSAVAGAAAFQSSGPLVIAPMEHLDAGACLTVQRWMPGDLLADVQDQVGFDPARARAVGAALAELHRTEALGLVSRERSSETILELGDTLARLCPGLATAARTQAATLFGAFHELAEPAGPVHGDFYAKQVLIHGDRAVVLDCDQARVGDPAEDLGNFRAHQLRDVLRGRLARVRADAIWEAVQDGYGRPAGGFRLRVQLFVAIGCWRLVADPFRHREPAWARRSAELLDLSAAALAPILTAAGSARQ